MVSLLIKKIYVSKRKGRAERLIPHIAHLSFHRTVPLMCSPKGLQEPWGVFLRESPPENRNQDRSQCKPLRRRNSDLLTDSTAISIQYFTPLTLPLPLQTYIVRKRDFLGGGYRQMHAADPSIGRCSDDVKVCIGFYLDSYSLVTTNPGRQHVIIELLKRNS